MRYSQVCPVVFGVGIIKQLGKEMQALGCKKVMLVSDAFMSTQDGYRVCKRSLEDAGIALVEFAKCLPDPPDTVVDAAGEIARNEKIDGLVAVGGGSVIDTAKAIGALMGVPGKIADFYANPVFRIGVPLVMIPTTAGTGSESTGIAVVTDTKNNLKRGLRITGTLGMLDPEITATAPSAVTAASSMDAFAHAMEALTSPMENPKSDLLALDAIRRIVKYLPACIADGKDMEARGQLLLASNFAGSAFNDAMVHLGHAIAHTIGAEFHVAHGVACGLSLPVVIKFTANIKPEKVRMAGEAMGCRFAGGESAMEIGAAVSEAMLAFMRAVNLPSYEELGISREQIVGVTDKLMADVCFKLTLMIDNSLGKGDVEKILTDMNDGYQRAVPA